MSKKAKLLTGVLSVAAVLLVAFAYYYVVLPPINIHAPGFWIFVIVLAAVFTGVVGLCSMTMTEYYKEWAGRQWKQSKPEFKSKKAERFFYLCAVLTAALVVIFLIGGLLSSEIVNASAYQKLLNVETRSFTDDIHEVSYDQIPVLDKDSATTIGNRVMGTMVDMVSQFEVSDMYTQINYQNKPVRVTPLQYGSLIKWFTNHSDGIPAYIRIDMTTQEAECVRLEQKIRYSMSDHFGRNIYRHLRFAYPTYMFDDISFEIDESGTPYWICPVKKYNIGLFGGVTIGRVVLCNAVTGEMTDYAVEDVPQWVDRVYSADMLISLYDYHGTLKHGYFNSVLSQKDCLVTTDGYNYIALDDDVWVYTGITSSKTDTSNFGFILCNQRTKEVRYYQNGGAIEASAMESAQDAVQNFGYAATFPILLDIEGQPSYFMSLYGDSNTVKGYALVSLEDKTVVGTGLIDTNSDAKALNTAVENYINAMKDKGWIAKTVNAADYVKDEAEIATAGGEQTGGAAKPSATPSAPTDSKTVTGKITDIKSSVNDGNTVYYLQVDGVYYYIRVTDCMQVLLLQKGDTVEITPQGDAKDGFAQAASVKAK